MNEFCDLSEISNAFILSRRHVKNHWRNQEEAKRNFSIRKIAFAPYWNLDLF